jgi:hypothetical protein
LVALPTATLDAIFNWWAISLPRTQTIIEGTRIHNLYTSVNTLGTVYLTD